MVVDFSSFRRIILEDNKSVHFSNLKKIERKRGVVVSEQETKEHKDVFKKRQLIENFGSHPYGYK